MTPPATQLSFWEVLRIPGVSRLWFAQIVSIFGDFLALFAVISVVSFRLHGTAAETTGVSLAYMLPLALVGPLAGVFVDRWNVKTTMIASDVVRAAIVLVLVWIGTLWSIYAVFFAISILSSFFTPAQSVTIRTLVPREGLLAANSLMMQALQAMRILSPAIAGALVASLGPESCFYIDAASFLFSAFMLSTVAVHREPVKAERGIRPVIRDLFSGMRFIFTNPALSFVVAAMGSALFVMGCFGPLIAIFVRDFLSSGSTLFGALSALIGVGMIAGSQLLQRIAKNRRKEYIVLGGLCGIGFAVLLIALVRVAAVTALGMFGLGFGVAFIIAPAQALFQQETPVAMVGRVSSSFMSVLTFAQIVGLAVSGSFAQFVGVRNLFFVCAAMLVALSGFGWTRLPRHNRSSAA